VNLAGQEELPTILKDNSPEVKKIFFLYPNDYEHKPISQAEEAIGTISGILVQLYNAWDFRAY